MTTSPHSGIAPETAVTTSADQALTLRFLLDYPHEAARLFEAMPAEEAAAMLGAHSPHAALRAWQALAPDVALRTLEHLDVALGLHLLTEAEPVLSVAVLAQMDAEDRKVWFTRLSADVAAELRELLAYPEDCAGRLMDPRVSPLRAGMRVSDALQRLRQIRRHGLRELFVVDDQGRLTGRIEIQDLALAEHVLPLADITRPLVAQVGDLDPREDVVQTLQDKPISTLPVVDVDGRFVGVIRQAELVTAVEEETSVDMQTMVGASPDERALSSPLFAVKKRLPWLQINLLTAFLAAAVVSMFESTIAQFTALAVTMRGLMLREISLRHWPKVAGKELLTGLVNGVAVALTTGLAVYVWSRSLALVGVIMSAMVVSMMAAGLAGALVPVLLRRVGQDPATASSIILTTVTDVVGFFSFLGIAALFAPLLAQSLH